MGGPVVMYPRGGSRVSGSVGIGIGIGIMSVKENNGDKTATAPREKRSSGYLKHLGWSQYRMVRTRMHWKHFSKP